MDKPTVHYSGKPFVAGLGAAAFLRPTDHPNHMPDHAVSNTREVRTSAVQSYDPATGRIETLNTVYMPEVV